MMAAMIAVGVSTPALGWENMEEGEDCGFANIWEDGTVLLVDQTPEMFDAGHVTIMLSNDNWSIKSGDELGVIRIETDGEAWYQNEAFALENGFLLVGNFEGVSHIFNEYPNTWEITRGGSLVNRMSMTGASFEWNRFKLCRDKKVAVVKERERQERLKREIPADPFAKKEGQ